MPVNSITQFIMKKHQSQWNWILMLSTLAVYFMALWCHSILLFFVTIAGAIFSVQDLPEPDPRFVMIDKLLEHERNWLKAPWGWKKGFQAFLLLTSFIYLSATCWNNSLMALLFFVGICANISCIYGNKAMGIDDL